jgi:putative protein kinase ArgK-like GTPase of G3E family
MQPQIIMRRNMLHATSSIYYDLLRVSEDSWIQAVTALAEQSQRMSISDPLRSFPSGVSASASSNPGIEELLIKVREEEQVQHDKEQAQHDKEQVQREREQLQQEKEEIQRDREIERVQQELDQLKKGRMDRKESYLIGRFEVHLMRF